MDIEREELTDDNLPDIMAEYESEEVDRVRRVQRAFDALAREQAEIDAKRFRLDDEYDAAISELLEVANEEGWTI